LEPLAQLVHEIRIPLTIVNTNLEFVLAELEAGRCGDELWAAIRSAREAVDRISVLSDGLATDDPPPSSVQSRAEPEPASGRVPRMARILIVDDEPSLGAALQRILLDYDAVRTTSGQEALEQLARGERFDLILCDLMMPGMSGDEVYREIRRAAPDQVERMVFITGGGTTEKIREFLANVPNTVVEKPFDVNKLREIIGKELLARTR